MRVKGGEKMDMIVVITGVISALSAVVGIALALIGLAYIEIKRRKNKKEIPEEEKIGCNLVIIGLGLLVLGAITSFICQASLGVPIR